MEGYGLIWLVLFLPLAGSLVQALFGGRVMSRLGRERGKRVMGWLAVLPVALAFAAGVALTLKLLGENPRFFANPAYARSHVETLFSWIDLQSIRIPFEVLVDPLSMTMVLIITGVGGLIHVYATGYMSEDRDYTRFFTYFNLFISAMLILVLANNLPLMFIGWEGVGLCSYLLIAFWYKDPYNARSGNKAFLVNRIGDWGLMLGMFLLLAVLAGSYQRTPAEGDGRWLSYDVIFPLVVDALKDQPGIAAAIALLFFVGACGKSAQLPLYFWLPDAMAGPTPVSALIHAATMVTAGVFLLTRMNVLFLLSPVAMGVVAVIGAATALFAALVAFGQTDIKRVLAYSTISQLGFMFVACGVGAFWAGMFHVTTHAFFKALLFLGSGAVIAAMAHEQDMRRYGNLVKYLKITAGTMIVGWIAISGIAPLAGFYSKEAILGGALGNDVAELFGVNVGPPMGWLLLGVALLTAAYMGRLTLLTFFGQRERWRVSAPVAAHAEGHAVHEAHAAHAEDPHGFFLTDQEAESLDEHEHHHELGPSHTPKEVGPSMWVPLVALAALSVVGGFALNPSFREWLFPGGLPLVPHDAVSGHPHGWVGQWLVALSLGAGVLGILYAVVVYRRGLPDRESEEEKWHPFRRSAHAQFGFDGLAMEAGVQGGGTIAEWLKKRVDEGCVDAFYNGVAWLTGQVGYGLRAIQTGFVRGYALLMLAGAVALLASFWYALSRLGGGP